VKIYYKKGIDDITVFGGGGVKNFVTSTIALLLKSLKMVGGGVKNHRKLLGVIYGLPLTAYLNCAQFNSLICLSFLIM
jgi:hypothetical protein